MYWQAEASCAGMPLEAFYGDVDTPMTRTEIGFAKRICQACPVLMDCAVFAMKGVEFGPDQYGVWAGSTPSERNKILKEHNGNVAAAAQYLVMVTLNIGVEVEDDSIDSEMTA
jgi:hypothetical protein